MENPSGQVLVIFGASGDLAKRKLLPALFALHCEGFLPKNFAIVGVGRTEMDSDQYRQSRVDDIKKFARVTAADFSKLDTFLSLVEYANFNTDNPNEYSKLADFIEKYVRKGALLYVEGQIRTREWTDRADVTRTETQIAAETVRMLGRREENTVTDNAADRRQSMVSQEQAAGEAADSAEDDGLPF